MRLEIHQLSSTFTYSEKFCKNFSQNQTKNDEITRGVSHCDLAICIEKYLEAKEVSKLKYFTM
jgi:hypothetical protein